MFVKPNLKNIFGFLIGSFFLYLFILIWFAKDPFPPIDVELRDLIRYGIIISYKLKSLAI